LHQGKTCGELDCPRSPHTALVLIGLCQVFEMQMLGLCLRKHPLIYDAALTRKAWRPMLARAFESNPKHPPGARLELDRARRRAPYGQEDRCRHGPAAACQRLALDPALIGPHPPS